MNFKIIVLFCMSVLTSSFPNVKEIASMYNKLEEESLKVSPRPAPVRYSKDYSSFIPTTEANVLPLNQKEGKSDMKLIKEKCKTDCTSLKAETVEYSSVNERRCSDSFFELYEEDKEKDKYCTNETLPIKKLLNATISNISDVSPIPNESHCSKFSDEDLKVESSNSSFCSKYFPEAYDSNFSDNNPHALTCNQNAFNKLLKTKNDSFDKKLGEISSLNE